MWLKCEPLAHATRALHHGAAATRGLAAYKAASNATLVAAMMGLAASGGYYVALPADHIMAHPTTITGSVGVIFLQPRVAGLMEKLGVGVDVSKSGSLKDMGSPFRPATAEEKRIVDTMTRAQATRFLELVQKHRHLGSNALDAAVLEFENAPLAFLAVAKEIAMWHHEKWDGSGYPDGLAGDAIPIPARLMALADVFDALASRRVYKEPMPYVVVLRLIREGRDQHFDPDVVDAFVEIQDVIRAIRHKFQG